MRIFLLVVPFCLSLSLQAGEAPMKYVDKEGRVIYSDRPVPGAVKKEAVRLPPAPHPDEMKAAQARTEKARKMIEEGRKEREKREKERQAKARERDREAAKVVIDKKESTGWMSIWRRPGNYPPVRPGVPPVPAPYAR